MKGRVWIVLAMVLSFLSGRGARAEDFLVIFDLSGSMGTGEEIEPAKEALRRAMEDLQTPGASWGLRVFGASCAGGMETCLAIPLGPDGSRQIRRILPTLEGGGASPLPEALRSARLGELRGSGSWRQTAIVVSDGLVDREEACREARLLRQDGVRMFVIGLEFSGVAEGRETLRYIAEHPDCAAGTYIRAERPDQVDLLVRRTARVAFGFPLRLIALLLALAAGYYTTLFFEYVLDRQTRLRRDRIPPLCRGLYLVLSSSSAGLFLTGGSPGLPGLLGEASLLGLVTLYVIAISNRGA